MIETNVANQAGGAIHGAITIHRGTNGKDGITICEAAICAMDSRMAWAGARNDEHHRVCDYSGADTTLRETNQCVADIHMTMRKIEQSYSFYLPAASRIKRARSVDSINRPFATTATMRLVCRMSLSGLPANSTRSASFPAAIVPVESSIPR